MKICPACQKEFDPFPRRSDVVYCSKYCANTSRCKRFYYRNHDKQKERLKKFYYILKENKYEHLREINMRAKTKQRFGVLNRLELVKLLGGKCVHCGLVDDLLIHHLDHQGRNKKNPNNDLKNLTILCRHCHALLHFGHISDEDIVRTCVRPQEFSRNV